MHACKCLVVAKYSKCSAKYFHMYSSTINTATTAAPTLHYNIQLLLVANNQNKKKEETTK